MSSYGILGVEQDNEIKGNGNSLEFKVRIYDPRLVRFLSVEPLICAFAVINYVGQ